MILEIDAGNSRIKWRLSEQARPRAERGVVSTQAELMSVLPPISVERIRLASVRGIDRTTELCEGLIARFGAGPEVAQVQARQAGVTNAYARFQSMGIDRWLSILAGFNRNPGRGCCVISCGTALTVDAVADSGQHLGGYIVPGLTLQRTALLQNTAIRLPAEIDWSGVATCPSAEALGRSTDDAVNGGILNMLVTALVNLPAVLDAAQRETLFLTGGDAATISRALQQAGVNHTIDQDIILDGLAYALP